MENVKVCGKMISGIEGIIQGDIVTMSLTDEELVITNGIVTRCIKHEDVLGAKTVSDINVQQQYVSSIGGAIVGGALFGVAGAAIGGRAKKKEIKKIDTWLIITYKEDEQPKNIAVMTVDFKYSHIINKYNKPVQVSTKKEVRLKDAKAGWLIPIVCFIIVALSVVFMDVAKNQNAAEPTGKANQEITIDETE